MSPSSEQRFQFDDVADLYDRYRPGYPEALFDDLFALSAIGPGERILEIGCGPGKATLPLARRGHPMTCLEPGRSLARIARRRLAGLRGTEGVGDVEVIETTFEEWALERGAFAIVVSAQAFHWVSPEVRFTRAAAALRPRGALAIVGNTPLPRTSPLDAAIDDVYARLAPELTRPRVGPWYGEGGPIPSLFEESGVFGPMTWRGYRWTHAYPVADYLGLLETHSDHRLMEPGHRASLHTEVGRIIERHGGIMEVEYQSHLYLAHTPGTAS